MKKILLIALTIFAATSLAGCGCCGGCCSSFSNQYFSSAGCCGSSSW